MLMRLFGGVSVGNKDETNEISQPFSLCSNNGYFPDRGMKYSVCIHCTTESVSKDEQRDEGVYVSHDTKES